MCRRLLDELEIVMKFQIISQDYVPSGPGASLNSLASRVDIYIGLIAPESIQPEKANPDSQ
jgi:hypothetical protein